MVFMVKGLFNFILLLPTAVDLKYYDTPSVFPITIIPCFFLFLLLWAHGHINVQTLTRAKSSLYSMESMMLDPGCGQSHENAVWCKVIKLVRNSLVIGIL